LWMVDSVCLAYVSSILTAGKEQSLVQSGQYRPVGPAHDTTD